MPRTPKSLTKSCPFCGSHPEYIFQMSTDDEIQYGRLGCFAENCGVNPIVLLVGAGRSRVSLMKNLFAAWHRRSRQRARDAAPRERKQQ